MLDKTDQLGGLYLGGYQAVINQQFLKDHNITHILNTAKGLEIFGPKYLVSKLKTVMGSTDLQKYFSQRKLWSRLTGN